MELWIAAMGINHHSEFWKATPRMVMALYDLKTGEKTAPRNQDAQIMAMFGG